MERLALSLKQRKAICVASGGVHPTLAEEVARAMKLELSVVERKRFPNTERYIRYETSVRGKHVFIIQALAATSESSVNDGLVELLLMVDAAKRASAADITVVAPYLAYSRQDRKARGREPISAAVVIRTLQCAGADRLVSIDMHSPQTQATFNGPFDHLTAEPLIQTALTAQVNGNYDAFVVVSPDGGRAKAAEHYADMLKIDVIHMPKSRDRHDSSKIVRPENIQGVKGRTCLLIDDMIDTAGTLVSAAEALKRSGARGVIVCATHGLFSLSALERLKTSPIDKVIVTDTVPQERAKEVLGSRLQVLSIASLLGRALSEIAVHGSVSKLFDDRNHQ